MRGYDDAVIMRADYTQILSARDRHYSCVKSRMMLWCKQGRGSIVLNGRRFEIASGDLLWTPWAHDIRYIPDRESPFLVCTVHVIPFHARTHEVVFLIPHQPGDRYEDCTWRKDCALPGLEGLLLGRVSSGSPLAYLADYITTLYLRQYPPPEELARRQAHIFLEELRQHFSHLENPELPLPVEMKLLLEHIEKNLSQPFSLQGLAETAGRGKSWVTRNFRRYLGVTPVEWVTRKRMEYAKNLLATTDMSVEAVGLLCGVGDPYYFSKLFKTHAGIPPREYRMRRISLG